MEAGDGMWNEQMEGGDKVEAHTVRLYFIYCTTCHAIGGAAQ